MRCCPTQASPRPAVAIPSGRSAGWARPQRLPGLRFLAVLLGAALACPAADVLVRVPFSVAPGWNWLDRATLDIAAGGTPVLRAEIRTGHTVVSIPNTELPSVRVNRRLAPGPHVLLLKLRGPDAAVCLDHEQVASLACRPASGRLTATFTPGQRLTALGKPRVQKVEPVTFADEFAREPEAAPQWDVLAGRFVLNTSLNPGSTQGAFQMWASAPAGAGVALATQAPWFWDDLVYGVSAMVPRLPATWGLVLHWVDPDTCHGVSWEQADRSAPGVVRLSRRRGGVDTVLAQAPLRLEPGQWYRLEVLTKGTLARVFVGGIEVLHARDPFLTGGRFGLFARHVQDLSFDDAAAVTAGPETADAGWVPPQPFGPGEQTWTDFSHKSFISDPFMTQWSHPRSFWEWDPAAKVHWFRSRLFNDVSLGWSRAAGQTLAWPQEELVAVVFADREQAAPSGYRVTLKGERVTLSRHGREVATATLASSPLDALRISVQEGAVAVRVNDSPCLDWQDPEPLRKGDIGMRLGPTAQMHLHRPDWRDTTRVESSHRLDYGFDSAPTAWSVAAGTWQPTHRWACVPKWSFFGGRGEAGPAECSHGNALLWNLRRFAGDIDAEIFAAPMEGTPQWVHFAHPANLNVAFLADGVNLDSGYMLEFGAYDVPSRLFRQGRPMAVWDNRVVPRLRLDSGPWYNRMSRVWQHLRIQRRGNRIRVDADRHDDRGNSLGLERLFDCTDEDMPTGDRLGVWTWGPNGLALARTTISFEASPGPAPIPAPGPAAEVTGGRGEPERYTRVHNPQPGGFFSHDLLQEPLDLDSHGVLTFAARFPANAVLSLMAHLRGQTAEMALAGPGVYRPYTIPLGTAVLQPSPRWPGWTEVRADLATPLRAAFPRGRLVLDRLAVSSPYDSMAQIAGLGVNRCGDIYDLADCRWEPAPAPPAPAAVALIVSIHGRRPLDDFEADCGGWERLGGPDGAALYRDPHEPAAGAFALRLLNQVVGGPAGAWITRESFPLAAFPRLRFDYRMGQGTEVNLLAKVDGRWFEVRFTGVDATWPVVGAVPGVLPDGQWHTAEVDLLAALRPRLGQGPGVVEGLALADTCRMSSWQRDAYWVDNVCRVPALDRDGPTAVALALADGKAPTAYSHRLDSSPDSDPGTALTGQGATLTLTSPGAVSWLHVRARRADGSWTAPVHLPVVVAEPGPVPVPAPTAPQAPATGLPKAPTIVYQPSDRLCFEDFEWSEAPDDPDARFGDAAVRRGAWVLRGEDDGAGSAGCLIVQNLEDGSFFSAYLHRSGWDPLRWPVVSFDYRFEQPGCALNLSMLVNEAMTIVGWTGPNLPGNYFYEALVGDTAPAVQDGAWHHTEFDLGAMLVARRFPDPQARGRITVTELSTWSTNHRGGGYVNPATARVRFDNLCIASNRGRDPTFVWRLPADSAPAEGYAVVFDAAAETLPPEVVTTPATRFERHDVPPGTWYVHVRAKGRAGWGPAAHRRIVIE